MGLVVVRRMLTLVDNNALLSCYSKADAVYRRDRARLALYEMGSTVFGGAVTSLGASAMLFGCWIQYFFKFGGFMFLTIGLSFLFCFFFFMPLMVVCGPNRTKEIDGKLYDHASLQCCFKYGGIDPPDGYVMANGDIHRRNSDAHNGKHESQQPSPTKKDQEVSQEKGIELVAVVAEQSPQPGK